MAACFLSIKIILYIKHDDRASSKRQIGVEKKIFIGRQALIKRRYISTQVSRK